MLYRCTEHGVQRLRSTEWTLADKIYPNGKCDLKYIGKLLCGCRVSCTELANGGFIGYKIDNKGNCLGYIEKVRH